MDDCGTLAEFGEDAAEDLDKAYADLLSQVESLEMRNMLSSEGDNLGAILKINSGAGGTEANDWSSMLMRMYMRWGERNGYKVEVSDLLELDGHRFDACLIAFEQVADLNLIAVALAPAHIHAHEH